MCCPTRRPAIVYQIGMQIHNPPGNENITKIVKGDYAGNAGDMAYGDSYRVCQNGPSNLAQGDAWFATPGQGQLGRRQQNRVGTDSSRLGANPLQRHHLSEQ